VRRTFEVTDPQLWFPGDPALYPVAIDAMDGERSLAGYRLHVGIREIRVTDDGLLLVNGHRVKLFGANIHEERAARGAALTPANRERDLELYGELGATLMRAHYPLHPRHLELADRLGVMVWDEVPVFAQGYKAFEVPGLTDKALAYIRAMVDRDRNHASVLAWSIANELSGRMTEDQEDYIHRAAQLLRGLDPTRLRTIVIFGWPQAAPFDVYHELDAIGINSYFGWYAGPNGSTEDRRRLSPFLDQMREYYPELALFVTEFGAESNREGPADQKGTYAFQRDLLTHHVRTYIKKPWLSGAIAWVLRDFRSRPDWEGGSPTPRTGWNQKGLLDYRSHRKPVFNPLARLYKSVPPVAARPYPFPTSR
jgi:beta-glucuronidase